MNGNSYLHKFREGGGGGFELVCWNKMMDTLGRFHIWQQIIGLFKICLLG